MEPAFHNSTGEEAALFLNGTQAANNLNKKFVWWSQTSTSEEGAVCVCFSLSLALKDTNYFYQQAQGFWE